MGKRKDLFLSLRFIEININAISLTGAVLLAAVVIPFKSLPAPRAYISLPIYDEKRRKTLLSFWKQMDSLVLIVPFTSRLSSTYIYIYTLVLRRRRKRISHSVPIFLLLFPTLFESRGRFKSNFWKGRRFLTVESGSVSLPFFLMYRLGKQLMRPTVERKVLKAFFFFFYFFSFSYAYTRNHTSAL